MKLLKKGRCSRQLV